jgi:membrane protease YdiL (CAAX protease family)
MDGLTKKEIAMTAFVETSDRTAKVNFIQRYPLFTFFLLAFGLTWIFMITDALGSHNILPFRLPIPLLIVMGYMPTLAAVIVTGLTKGREGVRALFRKLLIARVGWGWYAFAIFGIALAAVIAVLLYNLSGKGPAIPVLSKNTPAASGPLQLIPMVILLYIVVGLVNGEELAWRGFALPRLQAKYSALTSSLILGVIWTLFHLPLFFTKTGSSQAEMSFVSFLIATVSLTILYTWMYNNTRGSVLLAYLFHAAANTWTQVFSIDHTNHFIDWTLTGLIVLAAVIVVIATGTENL